MNLILMGAIATLNHGQAMAVYDALAQWLDNEQENADPDNDATEAMQERYRAVQAVVSAGDGYLAGLGLAKRGAP